jgi:hypothetical protein
VSVFVGLCESCRFSRVVENRRGSRFHLCGLAECNPHFPKYPRLPVLACSGYDPASTPEDTPGAREARSRESRP